jgi:tetratricopeptide (TPR) repeat protein
MRLLFVIAAAFVLVPTAAAQDTRSPARLPSTLCQSVPPELTTEQALLFCQATLSLKDMVPDPLAMLDAALAAIPDTSRANAMLMTNRAEVLVRLGQDEQAERAYEAALARYPDHAAILTSAINFLSFTEFHRDEAADHWLRLATIDADAARAVPDDTFARLVAGLDIPGQRRRALALLDGLDVIGYDHSRSGVQSLADSLRFRDLVARNERAGASEVLARMGSPDLLAGFAVDNAYRDYWPEIGWDDPARREAALRAWFAVLAQEAGGDPAALGALIERMRPYVPPATLLATYEEPFTQGLVSQDMERRASFAGWTQALIHAYLAAEDPAGAERLHEQAAQAFTDGPAHIRLGLAVQRAEMLADLGRYADAQATLAPVIGDPDLAMLSRTMVERLHTVRLRARHGLGQLQPGDVSLTLMRQWLTWELLEAVDAHMQIGEVTAARDALRRRLRMDEFYPQALVFLQPTDAGVRTPAMRQREIMLAQLRADPRLREALERRGRVLPDVAIVLADLPLPLSDPPQGIVETTPEGAVE